MIKLFNTLSKEKEDFKPIRLQEVGMYNCGPTVYNHAHIGNLRAYVFADILRRTFEFNGFKVRQVINITDVGHLTSDADEGEDKIEKGAKREGKTASEITEFYTQVFFDDLQKLNISTDDVNFPRATNHINEQITLIEKLENKGYTYKTSDGVYFDTSKYKNYGKLGNTSAAGIEPGARININSEKKNNTDFALWKFSAPHEKRQQEWDSPWGKGFPGWHIECSAMAMKYLGETFDIHTGGIDHIPIHHNNEIAQSECVTGKPFANYWLHSAFVIVPGGKMSKSLDNFLTLKKIVEKNIDPLAYRYWLLTVHYRSPVEFSWEALEGSQKALQKLKTNINRMPEGGNLLEKYAEKFNNFIKDDLNTPQALALVWNLVKTKGVSLKDKKATLLEFDKVLGLNLGATAEEPVVPEEITEMVWEREKARKEKDFLRADKIRDEISKKGWDVKDGENGPQIAPL